MERSRWRGRSRLRMALPLAVIALVYSSVVAGPAQGQQPDPVYSNPLEAAIPDGGVVESCADPGIIRGQGESDPYWYVYCTTSPLNDADIDESGRLNRHLVPILRSADLVNWTYIGNAFERQPDWVGSAGHIWDPLPVFMNGRYYMYYTASQTASAGSAIGVATAPTPAGPWVDTGAAVVEPQPGRTTYGPEVVEAEGKRYIYYGGYQGGIWARELSSDGLSSDPSTATRIAIPNRYEGVDIVERDGYYYLFTAATRCCQGSLTGYTVFAGRAPPALSARSSTARARRFSTPVWAAHRSSA